MKEKARKVAIGSIIMTAISVGSAQVVPIYLVPLSLEMGVSMGQLVLMFSFLSIAGLIGSLLIGRILKAMRIRSLVSLASVGLIGFFLAIAFSRNLIVIYFAGFVLGAANLLSGFTIAQTEITWWFTKGQAKMMSLVSVGVGVVGMICAPLLASAIEAFGLRNTAIVHGLIIGIIVFLCARTLLMEHPSTYGFTIGTGEGEAAANTGEKTLSLASIVKTPAFWFIIMAIVFSTLALTGFTNNASAFYQSIGLSAVQAAFCISVFSGAILVSSLLYGVIADKVNPYVATAIFSLIAAGALFAGTMISGYAGGITIAALMSCLSFTGMLGAICFPRMFGTGEAASLVGFSNAAASVGSILGAPIAGFIFDATGSYKTFLMIAACLCVLTVVLVFAGNKRVVVPKRGS